MAIHVICPNGHELHVDEKYAGKRGRCPKCREAVVIPVPNDSGLEENQSSAGEDGSAVAHSTSRLTAHTPMAKQRKPDTRRKKIRGHIERGGKAMYASSRAYAWSGVGGGLLCTGIGTGLFLLGIGVIDVESEGSDLAAQGAGAIFFLVGVAVLTTAIRSLRHLQLSEVLRDIHADEPWLADYRWDSKGSRDDTHQQQKVALGRGIVYIAAAIAIELWFTQLHEVRNLVPRDAWEFVDRLFRIFLLVAFLGYGLWLFGKGVYLTARVQRYGRSDIRFSQFPFFLGEKLEVLLVPGRDVGDVSRMRITLRCVEEVMEYYHRRGSGSDHIEVVCYQVWADVIAFRKAFYLEAGRELPITFALPEGAEFTSDLASRPMRYWELVVWAETAGVDYEAMFLVPVYAKPKRRNWQPTNPRS